MTVNERIIQLCKSMKLNGEIGIYNKASNIIYDEYGDWYSAESIRGICRRYRQANGLDESFNKIEESEEDVTLGGLDEAAILEKHGFDKDKFRLTSLKDSKWTNGSDRKLHSSKITVKPKDEFVWTQEVVDKIFENIVINPCLDKYALKNFEDNGKALILPIVDLHYAMSASKASSNNEYDSTEAKRCFFYVINDIVKRVEHMSFEKIYFTIGNDLLNTDNKFSSTTKGTPQTNCEEIENAIVCVTDMLIEALDILKHISKVEVIHIPGNHDYMISLGIANALRARYIADENVTVDCSFIERKYRKFGKTLIGFAHNANVQKINDLIQADARQMLAETTNTVYLLGHLHHEECVDVNGTDVRRLPTISSKSRWTYEKGYHSVKKNQSFILDSEYGITDVLYTIIK